MLKSYKELQVWQKAYQFCVHIYKTTRDINNTCLEQTIKDIGEIERMLKALIKSLEHKHSNP